MRVENLWRIFAHQILTINQICRVQLELKQNMQQKFKLSTSVTAGRTFTTTIQPSKMVQSLFYYPFYPFRCPKKKLYPHLLNDDYGQVARSKPHLPQREIYRDRSPRGS